MIPDEAVEAAAAGFFEACNPGAAWQHLGKDAQAVLMSRIHIALEAAAPHLMAPTMRAIAAEIGGDPATAVTDPAVRRLLKMLLDRADEMEATK